MLKSRTQWLWTLAMAAMLAACGSGGSGLDADMTTSDDDTSEADGTVDNDVTDPDATTTGDVTDPDAGDTTTADGDATTTSTDTDVAVDMDVVVPPMGWPDDLPIIALDAAGHGEDTSDFATGTFDPGALDWARDPAVGCWDNPTGDEFFSVNAKYYGVEPTLDGWHDVTVTITPDGNHEANVFVVQMDGDTFDLPPLTEARGCHVALGGPGSASTVSFRIHSDEMQNLLLGVGNRGRFNNDDSGAYTISVDATPVAEADQCYGDLTGLAKWPEHVTQVALDANGDAVFTDQLADGAPPCNLDYLEDAFCTPSIYNDNFRGNHRFYAIEGGIPSSSVLSITVTPDPGVDVSLMGSFQGAGTGFATPPFYTVQNCEASPAAGTTPNPGQPETISFTGTTNGYNIFFAVAGTVAQGATGGYTVSAKLITYSTDSCTEMEYEAVQGLSDWPASVTEIDVSSGFGSVMSNTNNGALPCTLDWAATSQNACFPGTQFDYFSGNHEFYALADPVPGGSNVTIRVIPAPNVDVSLYAMRMGATNFLVPPYVPSVNSCEASYHQEVFEKTPNPGVVEEITFYNPGANPYNYFIGVSAFKDNVDGGAYRVEVEIENPPPPHCPESLPGTSYPTWPTNVERIALDANGMGSTSGDISQGSCVNLDFMDDSDVACVPSIQFDAYEGSHVFYALDEPLPPNSEAWITVTPAAGVDLNAYTLFTGANAYPVPPYVTSVISCEAGLDSTPGAAEVIYVNNPTDTNMYNVLIGVAGPAGVSSGAFTIDVERAVAMPHCPESLPGPSGLSSWPANVNQVAVVNDEFATTDTLAGGEACLNMAWAANSSVACVPATQFDNYEGAHKFYTLDTPLPPQSVVTLWVQPDPGVDVNLYGYQIGATNFLVPPAVPGVVSCEVSHGGFGGVSNPGGLESITFYNPSTTASYNIFFAVAGPRGVTAGNYEIGGQIVTGTQHCPQSLPGQSYDNWPSNVTRIPMSNGAGAISGGLAGGSCSNLAFADDSPVACFPATFNSDFEGNQKYYYVDLPLVPGKQFTVDVTGAGANDINVYGFQTGTNTFYVPPYVPSVVSCEYALDPGAGAASLSFVNAPTNGGTYQVMLAVSGGSGTTTGGYDITVTESNFP